jgi:hypothetical protein
MRRCVVETTCDEVVRVFEANVGHAEFLHRVTGEWHWLKIRDGAFGDARIIVSQ